MTSCRLRISQEKVSLLYKEGAEVSHRPGHLDTAAEMHLFDLARLRHGPQQNEILLKVGAALARAYLNGAAGEALRVEVAEAERRGATVELGLEIDDALAALPWEALRLPAEGEIPGEPLALHPNVRLFRAIPGLVATPALPIPGPLRILVVIGSPEEQNARGELLDMERELERILDAVEPARKQERPAYVRILHRGTVDALRAELARERFHVLHITCHAGPGVLVLEREDGSADRVGAERLCREALVPDRGVPLVVLAGCATALSVRREDRGEAPLPGLARALLAHGVPAVLAMQAPVGDAYATALGARLYHALATAERADPLDAVSAARRLLETARRSGNLDVREARVRAEWATPALYLRGPSLPLLDLTAPFAEIAPPPEPILAAGVVVRGVGDFVGRRREERRLLQALRGGRAGILVHGLGGIGKSSLAAETLRVLFAEGWLVASLYGPITPDSLLAAAGRTYLAALQSEGVAENDPRRELAVTLGRPDVDWEERFADLSRLLLGERNLVLLLDNFEDNQGDDHAIRDEDLAALLARWVCNPGLTRFLITTRYPFELSEPHRLDKLHLGPLSFAETRKLIWRLPALDNLSPEDQLRAYADVGGHPRALEYLDALLRGGPARFQDVADRMEKRLEERGIPQPETWMKGVAGDLDRALAEAVTLAVDDVLLDRLLERLETVPLAKELLVGAAVYRVPVGLLGLVWQVGEEVEKPVGFLKDLGLLAPAGRTGSGLELFLVHRWTASAVLARAGAEEKIQPHHRAAQFWRRRVERMPQIGAEDVEQLLEARHHHYEAGEIAEAAKVTAWLCSQFEGWGAYWRVEQLCRETLSWLPERSVEAAGFMQNLGAISYGRGELSQALEWCQKSLQINEELGNQAGMASSYHDLGAIAHDRGEMLQALELSQKSLQIKEELGARDGMASSYRQLGGIAQGRGDLSQALEWYQKSLQIEEELGDPDGVASSYHQLGRIAQDRGYLSQALEWYQKSLQIKEALGNRADMAVIYHQLGRVAQDRDALPQALEWYQKSLQINEELGNRAGMAGSYHQLGSIARGRGELSQAAEWYQKSLQISGELGNRADMASSCHQLGVLAQEHSDLPQAQKWYQKSLQIQEDLGNLAKIANSYHNFGAIAQSRGDLSQALEWYQKSLQIKEELGNRADMAITYHQLGTLAQDRSDLSQALEWYQKSLQIDEELGNRADMAITYHQLGMLSQDRGDLSQALGWYQKSLKIKEELGNRAEMAITYHQLGTLAQDRGDLSQALEWYQESLKIDEELDNRAGMAISCGQLGLLAQAKGDYSQAEAWTQKALRIVEELGDYAGTARALSQLSVLAAEQGQPGKAIALNFRNLAIQLKRVFRKRRGAR